MAQPQPSIGARIDRLLADAEQQNRDHETSVSETQYPADPNHDAQKAL
jgi:hypothetical protein